MNGRPPTPRTRLSPNGYKNVVITNATAASRSLDAYSRFGAGVQYKGVRNIYEAAGYKTVVQYEDIVASMDRDGIAERLISIFPDYTWQKAPNLLDGPAIDGVRDTEFCLAWQQLWRSGRISPEGDTITGLDYSLPELDKVSLMGKYAVLFLGLSGDKPVDQPLEMNEFQSVGVEALAYTNVFGEGSVSVASWVNDPNNPRFGKPETYNLSGTRGGSKFTIGAVHWTRVIHLAQNGIADLVEGRSLLLPVYNLLQDIVKTTAGAGESGYRGADPGLIIKTQPSFEAPDSGSALDALLGESATSGEDWLEETEEQISNFMHGLQRHMLLEGYDVDTLEGTVVDPRGPVSTFIDLISGSTSIPQRLLLGNEAGQYASIQDQENWASVIDVRQQRIAEPLILRPIINRFLWLGVLPPPTSEEYNFIWDALYTISPEVQMQIATTAADVLGKLGVAVDPTVFVNTFMPQLDTASLQAAGIPANGEGPVNNGTYP